MITGVISRLNYRQSEQAACLLNETQRKTCSWITLSHIAWGVSFNTIIRINYDLDTVRVIHRVITVLNSSLVPITRMPRVISGSLGFVH